MFSFSLILFLIPAVCHGKTIYTKWGGKDCARSEVTEELKDEVVELLYSGFAVGTGEKNKGGASDLLCVPEQPSYDSTTQLPRRLLSHLFGAEYTDPQGMFGSRKDGDKIPCAVCMSARAVSKVFTATTNCAIGWTKEYIGYMSAGKYNIRRYSPICIDKRGELSPGSSRKTDKRMNPSMVLLSAECGEEYGLTCADDLYKKDTAIECVVCTY